jgi:hypothetical protein
MPQQKSAFSEDDYTSYVNPIKQSLENLTRLLQEQKKAIDQAINTISIEYEEVGNDEEYNFLGI